MTETGSFTLAYAVSAVGFAVAFIAFCILSVALLNRLANRRISRAVSRALDNGDRVIRDLTAEVDEWDREQVAR